MSEAPAKPNRLLRKMQIYAQAQWIFLGALLLTFGLFYVAVYRPQLQEQDALNRQIAFKRVELASDRSQTDRLPRVTGELAVLRRRLAGFKKLPSDPQYGQFIHDMNQAGGRASLSKFNVEPGVPRRSELYAEQPIVLSFEGSFFDVYEFIRQIEELDRLTRLRDVEIKAIDTGGTVSVRLSVNIYYSEG